MSELKIVKKIRATDWVDRGWYVVLDFGSSRSPQFKEVEELARSLPDHQELLDENGQVIYRNIFRQNSMLDFMLLYQLVSSWKSCLVYVNGNKVDLSVDEMNGLSCYLASLESNPNYCRNMPLVKTKGVPEYIGCVKSHVAIYPWGWKPWYNFVTRIHDGRYAEVNVADILNTVQDNLQAVSLCPLINWDRTQAIIEALPARIDMDAWPYWHINEHRHISPRSVSDYFDYMLKILGDNIAQPPA